MKAAETILIVDDSEHDRAMVRRYLRRYGSDSLELCEAECLADALPLVNERRFDLVVLDHQLPDGTGADLLRERERTVNADTAIVVFTGSHGTWTAGENPIELGADDYLRKEEVNGPQFRRALDNALHRARLRAKLKHQTERLRASLDAARERLGFESKLVSIVSHDMRSPLQAMAWALDILNAEPVSERGAAARDALRRSQDTVTTMVGQLLDLARVRVASGFPLELGGADVAQLVEDEVGVFRLAHEDRRFDVSCSGDCTLHCDPRALAQALRNLLENALKHGTSAEPIRVRVAGEPARVEIVVTNGAEPKAAREPSDPPDAGSDEGLGLGLYITEVITAAHGGRARVSSADSEFTVTLTIPRACHDD